MMVPSKITLYILKNNCTKFGGFVCFVPISSKFTAMQLDYGGHATRLHSLVCFAHYAFTLKCSALSVHPTLFY